MFLIAGIVQGLFGMGLPAIGITLLSVFIPPMPAIGLNIIPILLISLFQIFQTKNPYDLIEKSNFLITITPELYDSSTIMLDAILLETPVIQFILGTSNSAFNVLDEPISTFSENDNIEEIISKYMSNDYRLSLMKKIPKKLQYLLSNRGNSCESISKIIT